MSTTASRALTEIVPGTLWAIGGWLRRPGPPVTWIPEGVEGHLPVQGYALRSKGDWLLIDTGLPIHYDEVREGIRETSDGCRRRRMIMTRRELDCMASIPAILRDTAIEDILYAGVLNPLDFFDDVEGVEMEGRLVAAGAPHATRIEDGLVTPVGALRLEVLRTELRLLSTNWFYEAETRTLFSSDAFAFIMRPEPGSRVSERTSFDPAEIATFLRAKMDWLVGIDPTPIVADLDALQASRPLDRICPGFGCAIAGEAAVANAFAATREALRLLGEERRPSPLGGFRWSPGARTGA